MKTRFSLALLPLAALAALALGGCVVAPEEPYGYGYGYYSAPVVIAPPPLYYGGWGGGWGHRGR
ncbi:MAG: hypothetical protein P4L66_11060 [Acetobacteraceae bacterium]|nr:hypothetical protein [Acetobacteraceae bacterium]